jgi:ABC-2 type transport system permease protein
MSGVGLGAGSAGAVGTIPRPGPSLHHERPAHNTGSTLFVQAMLARAYVRIVGSMREPTWMLSDAIFPNLGMCAFVLLYRALGAPRSYEALAVVGGVLSTYWINVVWGMGAQLYWEKQQGQLQLYFAAPCSRMAILSGMAIGGLAATVLRSLVGVAIGAWVFHIHVAAFSPWVLAGVFVLTMVALYALGMTLSSLFLLYGREAWHSANALQEPVYFLSGLYFPIRSLGGLGAVAAGILPLTLGTDAIRQVLLGPDAHGLLPLPLEALALAAFSAVFLYLARVSLAYLEGLSKREGRLTQRWQ